MKAKYFLLGFIFLNLIVLSTMVVGKQDFDAGDVAPGTDLIWVVNVCNEDEMEDIFQPIDKLAEEDFPNREVDDWDDYGFFEDIEQGARMRWLITHARDETEYIDPENDYSIECTRLRFDLWKWTDDDEWEDPDMEKARAYMPLDPEDIGSDLQFLMPYDYYHEEPFQDPTTGELSGQIGINWDTKPNLFYDDIYESWEIASAGVGHIYMDLEQIWDQDIDEVTMLYYAFGLPMWIPDDADDYLDDMEFYEHRYDVDDKDLTITARVKENSYDFFDLNSGILNDDYSWYELPNEDFKYVAQYNEEGFMSNYKIWNDDHELILEFSLQMFGKIIPGYDVPIMLSVMATAVIAVIFIVMKKRK